MSTNDNWQMIGHEWAVEMLQNHISRGRVRHAYLFTGPEGVGRRTIALRLAQALNCQQSPNPGFPCRQCRNCQLFERQEHPDLTVIESEVGGHTIKVDQIREAQHSLNLTPFEAPYRTAILVRFEEANPSAANALLKTLEEPPVQVIMMLTAQDPEALLPTIVSRCEMIRLRPLSLVRLERVLREDVGLSEERARLLAHVSGGRPGYALRLHQDPQALDLRQRWLRDMQDLMTATRLKRFAYAEEMAKEKEQLDPQLQIWASFWRDVLLQSSGSTVPLTNIDLADEITSLAARVSYRRAREFLAAIERTKVLLGQYINARLALENLLLGMSLGRSVG